MGLIFIKGIGQQVKRTVISRKGFRPQISEYAPSNGELRKVNNPLKRTTIIAFRIIHSTNLIPWITPFIKNVCVGNVRFNV